MENSLANPGVRRHAKLKQSGLTTPIAGCKGYRRLPNTWCRRWSSSILRLFRFHRREGPPFN